MMAKKSTELTNGILNHDKDPVIIYINHDLIKHNIQLYKEAKLFKNEHNYKYLWIKKGKYCLEKMRQVKLYMLPDV